jgi:hypothetical protein
VLERVSARLADMLSAKGETPIKPLANVTLRVSSANLARPLRLD